MPRFKPTITLVKLWNDVGQEILTLENKNKVRVPPEINKHQLSHSSHDKGGNCMFTDKAAIIVVPQRNIEFFKNKLISMFVENKSLTNYQKFDVCLH
jgi:hypothetical protein